MSDYFWLVVNYVYDHRLTPAEGAGACASGATVGRAGGGIGAGAGCAISTISDAIAKFFSFSPTAIHHTEAPTIAIGSYSECDTSGNCDTSDSCSIPDFGGFGTHSDSWPTVSSGWT